MSRRQTYVDEAALRFVASRAKRNAVQIWEAARLMDTPAIYRAAHMARELLIESGVEDARVDDVPADGATEAGGWIMPVAWSISEARLAVGSTVLADYSIDPQSIAPWSPATPGDSRRSGPVRIMANPEAPLPRKLRDAFLFLREGRPTEELNRRAARAGAAGVIAARKGDYPGASRFDNAAVAKHANAPCVPSFSLSPVAADRLTRSLERDANTEVEARVVANRYTGTAPLVSASIGEGEPAVYLCAHIDEIGALDNASGCGTAIEAMRVLAALHRSRMDPPQRRAIRCFFSTEVRGWQWWLETVGAGSRFAGGINLDMTGAHPKKEPGRMQILTGFDHRPHFAAGLIRDAAAAASRLTTRLPTVEGTSYVSDAVPGLEKPGGHVSIEQETGRSYHTSADTAELLSLPTLRWAGVACVHFLYRIARLGPADAIALAKRINSSSSNEDTNPAASERARVALESLERVVPRRPPPFGRTRTELYRSGVRRSDGTSMESRARSEIRRRRDSISSSTGTSSEPARWIDTATAERAALLVPKARFRGFLGFDRVVSPKARRELLERTGLRPAWGTERWAWTLASTFEGRATLLEILVGLDTIGIRIDARRAIDLVEYLADVGMVTLRPIITESTIVEALTDAGLGNGGAAGRGSVVAAHVSLNRFGYVEGGAAAVVSAICRAVGPAGTVAMPTHTVSVLGEPPFRIDSSPSGTGRVTEHFRTLPGVRRSAHATHSVAVAGPRSEELVSEIDPDDTPMSRHGFWGRLYDLDGAVLILAPIRSTTILHVGEEWTGVPQPGAPVHWIDAEGHRIVSTIPRLPWHADHFEEKIAAPLFASGALRRHALGDGEFYLASARALAEASVECNERNPRVSIGRNGACDCDYCRYLKRSLET